MSISSLPIEIVCSIFCHVDPDDLGNIQMTSKLLHHIFFHHERFLCQLIAKSRGVSYNGPTDEEIRPLLVLQKQWKRHQIIESLLPFLRSADPSARQSLEHLWAYHDAIVEDLDRSVSEEHQRFIMSTSSGTLLSMIAVIGACGQLLADASMDHLDEESHLVWHDQRRAALGLSTKHDAFSDIALIKGIGSVAEVVVQKSEEAIEKITRWYKPNALSEISRLHGEYHWKATLLQGNTSNI